MWVKAGRRQESTNEEGATHKKGAAKQRSCAHSDATCISGWMRGMGLRTSRAEVRMAAGGRQCPCLSTPPHSSPTEQAGRNLAPQVQNLELAACLPKCGCRSPLTIPFRPLPLTLPQLPQQAIKTSNLPSQVQDLERAARLPQCGCQQLCTSVPQWVGAKHQLRQPTLTGDCRGLQHGVCSKYDGAG